MWSPEFKEFPKHPIANGVKPFTIRDEWYFNMRFRDDMKGVTPILSAKPSDAVRDGPYVYPKGPYKHIQEAKGRPETMMWAAERADGGRGVGFTGGHFHRNWQDDNFRKVVLNAPAVDLQDGRAEGRRRVDGERRGHQGEPGPEGEEVASERRKPHRLTVFGRSLSTAFCRFPLSGYLRIPITLLSADSRDVGVYGYAAPHGRRACRGRSGTGRQDPAGDSCLGRPPVPPQADDGDRLRAGGLLHHPHARRRSSRGVRVFNLDTGYQFPETLELRERIRERYGIEVEYVRPELTVAEYEAEHGGPLYVHRPDQCCHDRKIAAAAAGGRRATTPGSAPSAATRRRTGQAAGVVQWDAKFGLVKVNPLLRWTKKDVWGFILDHDVPYNPLHDQGYPSIGCWPCTRPVGTARTSGPAAGPGRRRRSAACT